MDYQRVEWDTKNTPLNPDNFNQMDEGIYELYNREEYSDTEKKIGKWIDGKNVYRKVVDFGTLPNNALKQVPHNINMSTPISARGIVYDYDNEQIFTIPSYNSANSTIAIWLDMNNICIYTSSDRTNKYAKVILEYTKTND